MTTRGKGWAKGLTAATDPRIARAAAGHRGKRYARRTPIERCGWRYATFTTLPLEWSDSMAYIVGLTATDGCLVTGMRRIDFKSTDREQVETYLRLLGRTNRIKTARTRAGRAVFVTQFKDARLYEWFRSIGLTPRKSLTIGAIAVPDAQLAALARGLLDGDGSVLNFVSAADTTRCPDGSYRYEWFRARFISASLPHMEWLQQRIRAVVGISGSVGSWGDGRRTLMHKLEYGRWESMRLLSWIYRDPTAPCLARKRAIWQDYAARHVVDVQKAGPIRS